MIQPSSTAAPLASTVLNTKIAPSVAVSVFEAADIKGINNRIFEPVRCNLHSDSFLYSYIVEAKATPVLIASKKQRKTPLKSTLVNK